MAGLPTFDGTYGGGLADAFVVKVTPGASCTLVGRQALTGLNTAYLASYYAYIDYLTYGTTNSYNALAFEYQAYLDSQTAQTAYANRNYTTAKRYFGSSATYASWGWQYAYAAYQASGSQYAYAAYVYGYYASAYEAQAYTEAVAGC
jgi:hypothetical protein